MDGDAFFEELYRNTRVALLKYLCGLNELEGWVEDILQDTYCEAYKQRRMLEIHPNPTGWLYKTAHNFYRNAKRRRDNRNLSLEMVSEERISATEGYYEYIEWLMIIQGSLRDKDSQLLRKYYLEGHSVREMAREFNLTEENIRVKLARIRKQIRALLIR